MQAPVLLDKERNVYYSGQVNFRRVSHVLNSLQEPFDSKGISRNMALSKIKSGEGNGKTVDQVQAEILAQWDEARDESSIHGTAVHKVCEDFFNLGVVTPGFQRLCSSLKELMDSYMKIEMEVIVYLRRALLAGTIDKRCRRQKFGKSLVDYFDYKTNIRKGIQYDSIKRYDDGSQKHYNRMMLHPVSHLEDCNFNRYALQLSLYAYMDQEECGTTPGKLGILFINKNQSMKYLPVPYMRLEAEAIINHYMTLKPLPR
jgi:hypothetical protein